VTAARYTVNAGRCIERDGKAFATIHGCGEYSPVELDQFADQVAAALNAQAAAASFDPVKENRKRVERTGRLLARYRLVTGDDPGDDVTDLLADLMHYADQYATNCEPFNDHLERARQHFESEKHEAQTGEPS